MSDKISMEALLPIALEVYKHMPRFRFELEPPEDRNQATQEEAIRFATFCKTLKRQLEEKV